MARGDRLRVTRRLAGLPVCYRHHGIGRVAAAVATILVARSAAGTVAKRAGRPLATALATAVRRQVG